MLPKQLLVDTLKGMLLLTFALLCWSMGQARVPPELLARWGQALPSLGLLGQGVAVTGYVSLAALPLWRRARRRMESAMAVGLLTRIEVRGRTYVLHYCFTGTDGTPRAGTMELLSLSPRRLPFQEGQRVPVAYAPANPTQHMLDL
jgi:hypothetical protein